MAESVEYITDAEMLRLGLPGDALSAVPADVRDRFRLAACDQASSYLKKRFTLPALEWGTDLKVAVARVAAFEILSFRGFDPASESGALVVKRADDSLAWLRDVARGIVEPVDFIDSTPELDEQGPLVESDEPAGWGLDSTSGGGCC